MPTRRPRAADRSRLTAPGRAALIAGAWLLAAVAGCSGTSPPADAAWVVVRTDSGFRFEAPADLVAVPGQALDSNVGRRRNATLELTWDLGWYSDPLEHPEQPGYRSEDVVVGGHDARLVTFEGFAGIHFPVVDGNRRLTVSITFQDAAAREDALRILRSIRFD